MNTKLKTFSSSKLRKFGRDRSGATAITFAMSVLPALTAVGAGVDYANGILAKASLQSAVDSAVLGAQLQTITSNAALQSYVQSQIPLSNVTVTSATYNSADTSMCATVQRSVPTVMMKIVGFNNMTAAASACSVNTAAGANSTYEIALGLDNTGSMSTTDRVTGKSKIASEITAANNFISQVFTAAGSSNVQMSVVPFTTAVNVGAQNATAAWMDTSGKSSIHWENFPKQNTTAEQAWNPKSRFDLFSQINQTWAGCVEERPLPYTFTDDKPDVATPDTLYVPMFAPDESDSPNKGYKSYNSYLTDNGGICATGDAYATADSAGTYGDGTKFFGDGQNKLCKYAVKYAANNPSAAQSTSSVQSAISDYMSNTYVNHNNDPNNWNVGTTSSTYWCGDNNSDNYCILTSDQVAKLIVDNNLYSVASNNSSVSFCTNFSVNSSYNGALSVSSSSVCYNNTYNRSGQLTSSTLATDSTATLPANYVNNPQGTSSANTTVASSGYTASQTFTPWKGSGWNYGGNGWGTGSGWGWGGSTGNNSSNSCGFNASTNNPGQTASGASSNLYIGKNQFNIGGGANSGCDATLQPLQTLTNSQSTLTALINKMKAEGATNLFSGMMWAWRTISPNGPFTSGGTPRAYNTSNNHKIIVFMTDGYNNWEPDDSQNGGVYSSLGFYHNNRAGALTVNGASQTPTAANNREYLDAAFLKACTNAKNAGVEIYTVAFSISNAPIDAEGQNVLKSCATDSGHFSAATDGTSLNTFFSSIGTSILQQTKMIRLKS